MRRWLLIFLTLVSANAWGVDEKMDFRLFLGRSDGNENRGSLADDAHRYTVGVGASSPIAWEGAVEANLELWLTERGYSSTLGTNDGASETMTFTAGSLAYGLRFHVGDIWRLYGAGALGLQVSRLSTSITTGSVPETIEEQITTSTAHIGAGIEYRHHRDLFALDWRRWYSEGDFGLFHARNVDLGGDTVGISLGHTW